MLPGGWPELRARNHFRHHLLGGRLVTIAEPKLPVDRRYHMFVSVKRIHDALDRLQPDVIEASSPYLAAHAVASYQGGRAKTHFHGLPSPAAGMTLATYYWFSQTPLYSQTMIGDLHWELVMKIVILVLSWLMVIMPLCGFLWLATQHATAIRVGTGLVRDPDDLVDVEVGLGRGRPLQRVRLVCEPDEQRVPVRVGVHRHAPDARVLAGPDHPDRDLAAVRDQDLLQWLAVGHRALLL